VSRTTRSYLGSYRLLNVVHTGHNSQMWQAYHDGRQEFCAVKTLLNRFLGDREQIGYLRQEYEVGSKVQSDRIIRIWHYGVDRGSPYLAMEWYPAPNMKEWVRRGTQRIGYLVPQIMIEATEAVVDFAKQGWVHRDIKPDNFLVNEEGSVKLIDFALAQRAAGFLAKALSLKTKVQGTRSYMSPEQIRGQPLDERADVYSLGCTFFELLCGRPPFTAPSDNELLMKHLRSSPPLLQMYNQNVTPEMGDLIHSTIAKKPSDRPESASDLLKRLRAVRVFKRDHLPPEEPDRRPDPPPKDGSQPA